MDHVMQGFLASLLAGLGTALGALPVLFAVNLTQRLQAVLLGIGGGIMLAATSFSLLVPGKDAAIALGFPQTHAALIMVTGMLLGGGFLWFAHNYFPHEHFFKGREGPQKQHLKQIWLFVIAIALHNLPEGLAVGVAFGAEDTTTATALALGIGLQNIPEGLVVALALRELGYARSYAIGVSTMTGLLEPIGGLFGAAVVSVSQPLLPWGMAFAAGAMLFVIVDEIIPEVSNKGWDQEGTVGAMIGFVVMMFLDVALG
ncbi:ZIP family metal transporter [Leptolyngbya sp. CCY15150]|uniref:ZIP family metal transporter n=1 Tax=Leptolyngbya sp. CCY15150 TaxID=2767772 RepID=UPI00195281C4|nr:ZIP family metal transporter [Leptolyngbya sp. CCY15150]